MTLAGVHPIPGLGVDVGGVVGVSPWDPATQRSRPGLHDEAQPEVTMAAKKKTTSKAKKKAPAKKKAAKKKK